MGYESSNLISALMQLNGLTEWYLYAGRVEKIGHLGRAYGFVAGEQRLLFAT